MRYLIMKKIVKTTRKRHNYEKKTESVTLQKIQNYEIRTSHYCNIKKSNFIDIKTKL